MLNKRIKIMILAIVSLLLIPLIAMQFTSEVNWSLGDFIFMGVLLSSIAIMYEIGARVSSNTAYRTGFGLALLAGFLIIWINLAVGIIGSENNPANLMYGVVLAIGFLGAILVRLKPQGLANVMFAAAFAQALVPVIAILLFRPSFYDVPETAGLLAIIALNAVFVILFIGAGLLFKWAAETDRR